MASAFKKIVQNKALADANVEGSDDDGVNVKAHMPIAREESGDESEKQDSAIDVNEEAPTLPNPEEELSVFKDADPNSKQWKNRQRTMVFNSRGITATYRQLVNDMIKLLPNSKFESKLERKDIR